MRAAPESELGRDSETPGSPDNTTLPVRSTPVARWLTHNHGWISGTVGIILLLMAVLAPAIAPTDQRGEVVIITVLFGLAGASMLYFAVQAVAHATVSRKAPVKQLPWRNIPDQMTAPQVMLRRTSRDKIGRAFVGLVFGLLFTASGIVAPFLLGEGAANPDARFLMVIGFSPVAISGALMVYLFGRMVRAALPGLAVSPRSTAVSRSDSRSETLVSTLGNVSILSGILLTVCAVVLPVIVSEVTQRNIAVPTALMGGLGVGLSLLGTWLAHREYGLNEGRPVAAAKTVQRRLPVPRIPSGFLYRTIVPLAIVLLFLLIVLVILVVIAATVTPLVR